MNMNIDTWIQELAAKHGMSVSFDEGLGVYGAFLFHWPDNRPPIRLDAHIIDKRGVFRARFAAKVAACLARRDRNRRKAARRAKR